METVFTIAICAALVLFGFLAGLAVINRKQRETEKVIDGVFTMLSDLLTKISATEERADALSELPGECERLSECCAELKKRLDELPVAQFEDEVGRMKAWNDGVDSILGYGPEVPKLNKEGLKHE